MFATRALTTTYLLTLLVACGGGGNSASIPEAEPAGESSRDIGDHVVHFSAQSTDQLPPDIARAYNIVRSKNRVMLNVAVLNESDSSATSANVSVKTQNLTGQLKNVTMREIREQEAIYYIGETPVANQETLIFDISVTPEGKSSASEIRFQRQFYTD